MTNEEVIRILRKLNPKNVDNTGSASAYEIGQALDIAIKIVEAESKKVRFCPKCLIKIKEINYNDEMGS